MIYCQIYFDLEILIHYFYSYYSYSQLSCIFKSIVFMIDKFIIQCCIFENFNLLLFSITFNVFNGLYFLFAGNFILLILLYLYIYITKHIGCVYQVLSRYLNSKYIFVCIRAKWHRYVMYCLKHWALYSRVDSCYCCLFQD